MLRTHAFACATILVVTSLLGACATPRAAPDRSNAERLAQAERDFSSAAGRAGVKAAFIDAMADDATLFRPGPVNGKRFFEARPDVPVVLQWQPQRVTVAASGELGFSTGPWRLAAKAQPDTWSFGQFFTVWRRNGAGRWEVLIDHGIEHAGSIGWASLDVIDPPSQATPAYSVVEAEEAFSRRSEDEGLAAAYRVVASDRMRLLRDRRAPLDGTHAIDDLPDAQARWTWSPTDHGTAVSADFAWVVGRYRSSGAGDGAKGFYVRVWRAKGGVWTVLADVLAPMDEPLH